MRIIAHRGVSSLAPENTMAAFTKCLEVGVKWFELDVRMLADNSLIVAHDETADRTTSGTGSFYDMTFTDLRRLDAGRWFGDQFRLERVPELTTVVELVNGTDLAVNVELKFSEGDLEARQVFVETAAQMLQAVEDKRKLLVSSFSTDLLAAFSQLLPDAPIAYLTEGNGDAEEIADLAVKLGCQAVNPNAEGLTEEAVSTYRGRGLAVYAWTVNQEEQARELAGWGVSGIITDYPQVMVGAGLSA